MIEQFCIGLYTMVPPAEVTNRLTADTGLDAPPDPPLTDAEMERVVFAAKRELLLIVRGRSKAQSKTAPRRASGGALSDRAELLLGLVRENTEFVGGEITHYFVPKKDPVPFVYGRRIRSPGFRPSGSGDAAILRSLERRGLIRPERLDYSFSATAEGIALYDEIKKRRAALPVEPDEVDDE